MSGSELAGIIDQVVNASADIVARARNAVEVKGGMLR
jgi:hypothetical protein